MADFFIDPSAASNGSGTFANPYNTWSGRTLVAGNRYLQKRGATFAGSIGPLGTGGTANSRIIVGVYDPVTGAFMDGVKGGAFVDATGQSFGFNITQARPYITVSGFEVYGATSACVTKTSTGSSSTEAQYCWFENCILRDSLGAGADIRGKGNRLINCDVYGNASDGLFIVGDDFELGHSNVYNNGLTNAEGDCVQLRDASNWYVHDSTLDHSLSAYKQAFISTLEFVPGTTGGRYINNHTSVAQYDAAAPKALRAVQILTPGVSVIGGTVTGGQYGVSLEGASGLCRAVVVRVTGAGAIGVLVKANDVRVQNNTVIGAIAAGSIGIDHNSAAYTGAEIDNNALAGWLQAIRTADSGATYGGNAFEECAVRNSDLAGGERAAGSQDITDPLNWTAAYRPRAGSPLLTGRNIGYRRDSDGRQARGFVGAYAAAALRATA